MLRFLIFSILLLNIPKYSIAQFKQLNNSTHETKQRSDLLSRGGAYSAAAGMYSILGGATVQTTSNEALGKRAVQIGLMFSALGFVAQVGASVGVELQISYEQTKRNMAELDEANQEALARAYSLLEKLVHISDVSNAAAWDIIYTEALKNIDCSNCSEVKKSYFYNQIFTTIIESEIGQSEKSFLKEVQLLEYTDRNILITRNLWRTRRFLIENNLI